MNIAESTQKQRSEGPQKSRQFSLKAPAIITMTAEECKSILDGRGVEYLPGYEERVLQYSVTDESQDSYGDIVRAAGVKLERYLKNPVVLYAHQGEETPVGHALKTFVENKSVISQDLFLDNRVDSSGRSDLIFKFAKSRMMPGVSIGFMPLEAYTPMNDEERKALGLGQYGVEYKTWEKLEHSPCSIPSNPNALLNALKAADLRSVRFEQHDFDIMVAWKFMELNCIDAFAEGLKKKYKNVVFSIPRTTKAEEPVMVTCKGCNKEFDYGKQPEVSTGAVKCPNCGAIVNQEGTVMEDEKGLILSELKALNESIKIQMSQSKTLEEFDDSLKEIITQVKGITERLSTPVAIEEKSFNDIITRLEKIEKSIADLPSQRSEAGKDEVVNLYGRVFGK